MARAKSNVCPSAGSREQGTSATVCAVPWCTSAAVRCPGDPRGIVSCDTEWTLTQGWSLFHMADCTSVPALMALTTAAVMFSVYLRLAGTGWRWWWSLS